MTADTRIFSFVPPSPVLENAKAEQALLGALLNRPDLVTSLPTDFKPEHYADAWHREVHQCVVRFGEPGVPAGLLVIQHLGVTEPDKREYVGSLLGAGVSFTAAAVARYAAVITDLFQRRKVIEAARRMIETASTELERAAGATLALAQLDLDGLVGPLGGGDHTCSLDAAMDQAMAEADAAFKRGGVALGVSTGFASVDRRLGRLEAGTLNVLGGRPGMGKSSLGWQWAINAARAGEPVLVLSLEMTKKQLARRALSIISGVPHDVIREGRHAPYAEKLIDARQELDSLPMLICDKGGQSAADLTFQALSARRKFGRLGLIMVDHLHIVKAETADVRAGATWAVGQVSLALKALAKANDCAVLALAQLSRGPEGRDDKRPTLADLRQAGSIEQDADSVCFLYRGEYYLGNTPPEQTGVETADAYNKRRQQWENDRMRLRGRAELICSKVRDGDPGTVHLNFDGPTTSFTERGV